MPTSNHKIGFIGGGNMAASIIGGLIAHGHDCDNILVGEPGQERRDWLVQQYGVLALEDNAAVAAQTDLLVLAVKPQMMDEVIPLIAGPAAIRESLLISIAAGYPVARIQQTAGRKLPVVRAMPNTPALIQAGISGAWAMPELSTAQREMAGELLAAVGQVRWFAQEADLDAVTAVSGSGPAYFFYLMESMQGAAEKLGLGPEDARALVLETALGAARLAQQADESPGELRKRVTSPGGTTQAAIEVMAAGGLTDLVERAMSAAARRAAELANPSPSPARSEGDQ